jgi:hypothetical protein
MTAPPIITPGALGQLNGRYSKLLYSWEAEDGTLQPRSGQLGTFTPGSGVGTPWLRGQNGLYLQSPLRARFEVGDSDNDGVLDDRTSLLLEPAVTNLIENASAELDLVGIVGVASGAVTRETGQDLHYPGATSIGAAGSTAGDGAEQRRRDGAFIVGTPSTNHAQAAWVKPNAAAVGRALKVQLLCRDNSSVIATIEITTPVLRAGWQRVALFAPASAVPGGTTRVVPRIVLASSAASQAVSIAGWTLVSGQAVAGSPVFTSTAQVLRQSEDWSFTYTRIVQPHTVLVTCALESPLLPSQFAGNVQPYDVYGIGSSADTAGGWFNVRWTGAGWSIGRSVGGVPLTTTPVLASDTLKGWIDVLGWLYPDGGLQVGGIRGLVNGVLTEFPGSAKAAGPASHVIDPLVPKNWSANRIDSAPGPVARTRVPSGSTE